MADEIKISVPLDERTALKLANELWRPGHRPTPYAVAQLLRRIADAVQPPLHERIRFDFYHDAVGKHRWRSMDTNGLELAKSSQGYSRLVDAKQCARRHGWVPPTQ